jgi:hypothetical protein
VEAFDLAMQAREIAPTIPFAVLGWGLGSAIARNAGESSSATAFAKRAQQLLESVDARALAGEERFALLSVAENCAPFAPAKAAELFATYWGLAPADRMLSLTSDPRLDADETFIAGVIAQATGSLEHAAQCYRQAFERFRGIGYVRRAITAAHALLTIDIDLDAEQELRRYIGSHLAQTQNYITMSLGARMENGLSSPPGHPIVASLPPTQREVVALICSGKTNKEIAALRNVGEQTIKNMLTKYVFPAFGVSSRSALVSMCLGKTARS